MNEFEAQFLEPEHFADEGRRNLTGWCAERGLEDLARVTPMHVAAYVEQLGRSHAKPTVKQHLAAIRMLFDWLVTGHIIDTNPAHAVRGPKHSVRALGRGDA